ncbi:hypothetical protein PAMC26510_30350 [Caballeronia sordidicola]|uniref:Uncharacterized protein n=1 Tax=Caballeronia sordidicola TaxID=196367 RepID=A0A242M964_CABSO|nr:hypothetical protein PAMC26510_30350 [Caballeronia sordidicola]
MKLHVDVDEPDVQREANQIAFTKIGDGIAGNFFFSVRKLGAFPTTEKGKEAIFQARGLSVD